MKVSDFEFRIQGPGFRVHCPGSGFKVEVVLRGCLRFWVIDVGSWIWDESKQYEGFRFQISGSGIRVEGSGFREQSSRFRVQGSASRVQG